MLEQLSFCSFILLSKSEAGFVEELEDKKNLRFFQFLLTAAIVSVWKMSKM